MAFVIDDAEIEALAARLMAMSQVDSTEAVRRALRNEVARAEASAARVDVALEFARQLRAKGDPDKGLPVDKAFYDSLSDE